MKQYAVSCPCGRSELNGFEPPKNPQMCTAARDLRGGCRELGCGRQVFTVREIDAELSDVDMLRLEMREERAIA